MTRDASLPPNAPTPNGTLTPSAHNGRGEADASNSSHPKSDHEPLSEQSQSLREVCADIHSRINAFLADPTDDDVIRGTQEQTRIALEVIEKALDDYKFKHLSLSYNGGKDCLVLLLLYLSVLHTHFNGKSKRRWPGQTNDADSTTATNSIYASGRRDDGEEEIEDDEDYFPATIPSIYAKPPDPFPLVTSFVESSSARYHLDLVHISTNPGPNPKAKSHTSPPTPSNPIPANPAPSAASHHSPTHLHPPATTTAATSSQGADKPTITFRDAFSLYLSSHPLCRAIFVGTRRTDPHGATLQHFQLTDGLWPRFMRVHPVLDFTLAQVWAFLRHPSIRHGEGCFNSDFNDEGNPQSTHMLNGIGAGDGDRGGHLNAREIVDYCEMYDQGYTSLGGVGDTHQNPKLKVTHGADGENEKYRPAWTMTEDGEERLGRE